MTKKAVTPASVPPDIRDDTLLGQNRYAGFLWRPFAALAFGVAAIVAGSQLSPLSIISIAAAQDDAQAGSVTDAIANFAPDDPAGEWRSQARDYANTRFSKLDQIDTDNVDRLQIAWTFSDGTLGGKEIAPLVIGDTMYVVTPFPNIAYALDLTKPGAWIKWKFEPNPSPVAIGKACCDTVNRGLAYVDGKIIYNLLDVHTVAVDAKTGKEVWRTKLGNVENGETMTMAPFVVDDKVYVGNSGGEMGVRGWLAALDVESGKEIWRAYSTGSDEQVLIGDDFKPFYDWMQGDDLGAKTWPNDDWKHGGGAVWGWISYDPDLNLLYYGTSNPSPRVPSQRPGDNLWTAAVIARDADTGMAKWAYQFTPHDQWDYDGVNENILLDMPIEGEQRKVMVHLDRNGYAYTIDRETGEVLLAKPFSGQNWTTGFDSETARPKINPAKEAKVDQKVTHICPSNLGGKDWQPAAFSPDTGLVYAGIFNFCMDLIDHEQGYIAGTPYNGMEMSHHAADDDGKLGEFIAWDPAKGRKVWSIKEDFLTMSGVLATAGDLVFYGTVDGWFRAVNAQDGSVLWSEKLGSGVISQPMTYRARGRQYIAVYAGVGGEAKTIKSFEGYPAQGATLYVFSIDGKGVQDEAPGTHAGQN